MSKKTRKIGLPNVKKLTADVEGILQGQSYSTRLCPNCSKVHLPNAFTVPIECDCGTVFAPLYAPMRCQFIVTMYEDEPTLLLLKRKEGSMLICEQPNLAPKVIPAKVIPVSPTQAWDVVTVDVWPYDWRTRCVISHSG